MPKHREPKAKATRRWPGVGRRHRGGAVLLDAVQRPAQAVDDARTLQGVRGATGQGPRLFERRHVAETQAQQQQVGKARAFIVCDTEPTRPGRLVCSRAP